MSCLFTVAITVGADHLGLLRDLSPAYFRLIIDDEKGGHLRITLKNNNVLVVLTVLDNPRPSIMVQEMS